MSSVATVILSNANGSIEFSAASGLEPPQLGRRYDSTRIGMEQGSSMQKVSVELSGFFEGDKNSDITLKIDALTEILKSNTVNLYYHDGSRVVINQECWISTGNDPAEWKEYIGNYSISMYYFQKPSHNQVTVSWESSTSYTFDPAPALSRARVPNRKHHRAPITTYSGAYIGNEVQVTLEGQLAGTSPQDLNDRIQLLGDAFANDGILHWGGFYSQAMRIIRINVPSVYPAVWCTYSIDLAYDTEFITEFSASRRFSGLHQNPLIRENLMCPVLPQVTLRNNSGQYVSYNIKGSGYEIPAIRSFLHNEVALMIYPNGVRMEGGEESWNEHGQEPSVAANFTYYYPSPVLANIED